VRTFLLAASLVALASSAFAQVPVYSNRDSGAPQPVAARHVITPAEYQSLVAHQFVCACGLPRFEVSGGSSAAVAHFTTQPLPPTYPLQTPWSMWSYTGHGSRIPAYGVTVGTATVSTPLPLTSAHRHR
jgi:hypothetical protein